MANLERMLLSLSPGNVTVYTIPPEEVAKELKSDSAIRAVIKCAVTWRKAPTEKALGAIAALRIVSKDSRLPWLLTERLSSKSAGIRYRAAYVLKNVPQAMAFDALKVSALKDKDENVRICCLHALLALALGKKDLQPSVAELCVTSTRHKSHGVRHAGYECLAHLAGTGHEAIMRAAARDANALIAKSATAWMDTYLGR